MEYSNSSLTLRYEAHGLPGCPTGAITFEEREAPEYDEAAVKAAKAEKAMVSTGKPVSRLAQWPCQIKLVPTQAPFFAGAGASVDKPTSLPNFADLAKEIAEDTGKTLRKEPCEVFLGALKAGGIDVNGIAAHILSDSCLKHNALHEAILSMLLNSIKDLGFGQDYLIRVVQSLQGLDEKENKQLQEALIKHGITLSLS